ncbi:MAG: hypothetical protein QXH35_03635, partial [Nitrososphaerota archaeon]
MVQVALLAYTTSLLAVFRERPASDVFSRDFEISQCILLYGFTSFKLSFNHLSAADSHLLTQIGV